MATFGSLFTGIRGLDRAVEALGHRVVWHAEIDPDASKELARQRPDIPNHGDVTKIDYAKVEPVDGLMGGGWPCQPFSGAGSRLGEEDPRYLWPEVARALRALRPKHFYMEQVADVLDDRRFPGIFGRCLADLAAAGLHASWGCLRASDVGAPHGRKRLFLAAHAPSNARRERNGNGLSTHALTLSGRREGTDLHLRPARQGQAQDRATGDSEAPSDPYGTQRQGSSGGGAQST